MRLTEKHLAGIEALLNDNADHELTPKLHAVFDVRTDEALVNELHDDVAALLRDKGDGMIVTSANLGVIFDYFTENVAGRFSYASADLIAKTERLFQSAGVASRAQLARVVMRDIADLLGVRPPVPPTSSTLHQSIVDWRKRLEASAASAAAQQS